MNWFNLNARIISDWLDNFERPLIDYRLPDDFEPTLYDLTIQPFIGDTYEEKSFTFDGTMIMHLKCKRATNKIVFHSHQLKIDAEKLKIESATDPAMNVDKNIKFDFVRQFVTVFMSKDCVVDAEYMLTIVYEGPISDKLNGFYRSSYIDSNNTKQ